MKEVITIQFDGGSRGNPGPAGIGVVLRAQDGTPLVTLGRFIGRATNNVAEYKALITGLQEAKKLGATKVVVKGDSELVVKQMRGEYRVKNPDLRVLYEEAQDLIAQFDQAKVEHNYRESNALADKLANLAMDRKQDVLDADDPPPAGLLAISSAGRPAVLPRRLVGQTSVPGGVAGSGHAGVHANDAFDCPRCGCQILVRIAPNRPPSELGAFLCACGVRMKPIQAE